MPRAAFVMVVSFLKQATHAEQLHSATSAEEEQITSCGTVAHPSQVFWGDAQGGHVELLRRDGEPLARCLEISRNSVCSVGGQSLPIPINGRLSMDQILYNLPESLDVSECLRTQQTVG